MTSQPPAQMSVTGSGIAPQSDELVESSYDDIVHAPHWGESRSVQPHFRSLTSSYILSLTRLFQSSLHVNYYLEKVFDAKSCVVLRYL